MHVVHYWAEFSRVALLFDVHYTIYSQNGKRKNNNLMLSNTWAVQIKWQISYIALHLLFLDLLDFPVFRTAKTKKKGQNDNSKLCGTSHLVPSFHASLVFCLHDIADDDVDIRVRNVRTLLQRPVECITG